MAKKTMKEMSFLEHLEVLRWLLIRSTIAMLVMATITFFVSDYIWTYKPKIYYVPVFL